MSTIKILCDNFRHSNLSLLKESPETESKKQSSTAIGVLEGVCADYSKETRNSNYYSRKLWENVINSSYVKECLETKTLFGELDHPLNRLESLASEAAVCCTALWFNEEDENDTNLYGRFDILPTKRGRDLKALCDYGSVLGVSCRGVGDVEENKFLESSGNYVNYVLEDSYEFVCFDVVIQPAVVNARQRYKSLSESSRKRSDTLRRHFKSSIESSKCIEDVDNVIKIAKKVKVCDEELLESAETKRKTLEKILEERASVEVLQKDLQDAYEKVSDLEERLKAPFKRDKFIAELSKLNENFEQVSNAFSDKLDSILRNSEESSYLKIDNTDLKRSVEKKDIEIDDLTDRLSSAQNRIDDLENMVKSLRDEISDLNAKLGDVSALENGFLEFKEAYLRQQESQYGVPLTTARRGISDVATVNDMDSLINESLKASKYRNSPVVTKTSLDRCRFDEESAEPVETGEYDTILSVIMSRLYGK